MGQYRKKPVVIEAKQITDLVSIASVSTWMDALGGDYTIHLTEPPYMTIDTIEGDMRASLGWWVIRGVAGEFYPCDPDIFEATYEPA